MILLSFTCLYFLECVHTHPQAKEVSVTQWNCLCCVGCCHCWLTSWTSIFSASCATQCVRTAASWAVLSLVYLLLRWFRRLTRLRRSCWCWHHRSTSAWPRGHRHRSGFRCCYSEWVCQRCCGVSHSGPWQRLPRQPQRALDQDQTHAEVELVGKVRGRMLLNPLSKTMWIWIKYNL